MTKTTDFGAGIFDEPAKIELTEREIAIARGQDPDAKPDDAAAASETTANDEVQDDGEEVFSADDREIAAKHGITEDELAELGSSAALRKAVAIAERVKGEAKPNEKASESGDKPNEASPGSVTDKPASDAAGGDAAEYVGSFKDIASVLDEAKIDLAKIEQEWGDDETSVTVAKAVVKTQEALKKIVDVLNAASQQQVQVTQAEQAKQANEIFHNTLDQYSDEFGVSAKDGKPVALSKEHEAARTKVRDAAETLYAGMQARGEKIPPIEQIIERAVRLVNGVPRKTTDKRQALVQQSSLRRTAGSSAGAQKRTPVPVDGSPESIASHPEITKKWNQYQEANGAF